MALLRKLQREQGMGLVMITHDLAVVAEMAEGFTGAGGRDVRGPGGGDGRRARPL